jgi:hypothetical protein
VAECRANEEKVAKEKAFAKQKEALKSRVSATTTKKAPAPSKQLTVETDNKLPAVIDNLGKSDKMLDTAKDEPVISAHEEEEKDDDFDRDDDHEEMTRE